MDRWRKQAKNLVIGEGRPSPRALTASDRERDRNPRCRTSSSVHTAGVTRNGVGRFGLVSAFVGDQSIGAHEMWYQLWIRFGARSSCRPRSKAHRWARCRPIGHRAKRQYGGVRRQGAVKRSRRRPLSPSSQCLQYRFELATPLRELIDVHTGGRWYLRLIHDPCMLQLTETHRHSGRGGSVSAGQKLSEALGPEHQLADHDHGPTIADDVEGVGGSACVPVVGVATANRHSVWLTARIAS